MTRRVLFVVALMAAGAAACAADVPRYVAKDDHFSIAPLDGWRAERQLGSVVFVQDEVGEDTGEATIAVRSVAKDWAERRDTAQLLAATEKVLRSLPGAQVSGPVKVDKAGAAAFAFDLTWTPEGQGGARFERRHVVVIGRGRVLHLLHTGPAGSLADTQKDFDAVVATIREEV